MTSKRYHKLFTALMTAIANDPTIKPSLKKGEAGRMLRGAKNADPISQGHTYAEAWEILAPIRKQYGL